MTIINIIRQRLMGSMTRLQGFTILEFVVIIVLLGILSVSITMCTSTTIVEAFNAEGFANVFREDVNYTKELSMSLNQSYRMVIGANSYQIQNSAGAPVILPSGSMAVNYPAGLSVTPQTTVIFDAKGTPYIGSSPISNVVQFNITMANHTETVSIQPQTGLIQ